MEKILMALDFSEFTGEVENRGFALAARLNASVTLVSVVSTLPDLARPDTGVVYADNPEERLKATQEQLETIRQAHPDVPANVISFIGDPKTGIIDSAIRENAACIIVGTHGRTGLSHLLLGSVAEYIVRHSPVPVLVVPYRKEVH